MPSKLTTEQIQNELHMLNHWTLNNQGEITRTFQFKNFIRAMIWTNGVALFAEEMNHHPDILIQYNKVTLTLSTHDARGLTSNDFKLAQKINTLPLT